MGARAKSAGAGAGAGAARAVIQDPAWRKANKDFVRNLILEPCIEKACKLGEAMLAARARQAAFETRELQKAVCVASLFGTASVSGDAHSSLAVVEQDGLAVVCSRNEFLQLSMHTAPLPQLGLSPLIRQTPQQAAELPSTAKVHSTTVSLLLLLPPPPASSRLLRLLLLLPLLLLPPPPASSASSPPPPPPRPEARSIGPCLTSLRLLSNATTCLPHRARVGSCAFTLLMVCVPSQMDAAAARVFALHMDGTMLVWGGRHGELRHSAQLLPSSAMAAAPPTPLVRVDEESQLLVFDCSWHDGTVRVLEPLSLDVLCPISACLPGEPAGSRRVAHMVYVEPVQLLLCSFEGATSVVGYDGSSGEIKLHLEGHSGSPPGLKWLLRPSRLATLGAGAPPFGDPEFGGDCSIRLWRLTTVHPPKTTEYGAPLGGGMHHPSDGPMVDAVCERVLLGHTGPITDVTFLPEANLLVSCAHDRTVRFWDAEASPHPLTAPEGGARVRVGPGRYEPMRPEWTVTNPPYVNCLVLHTQDPPLSLAAVTGWRGPEGLLVLTAHSTPRRGSALLGPPPSALPAAGGTLALWAVTRAFTTVEARRFDEVLHRSLYSEIEATAARDWRHALQRLREAEAGFGEAFHAERAAYDAARNRAMELLRAASLQRPSLASGLEVPHVRQLFAQATAEATALEARARGRSQPDGRLRSR